MWMNHSIGNNLATRAVLKKIETIDIVVDLTGGRKNQGVGCTSRIHCSYGDMNAVAILINRLIGGHREFHLREEWSPRHDKCNKAI